MKFPKCKVQAARLNMGTSEITISFTMAYDDINMEAAVALADYIDDDRGKVEVEVNPQQPALAQELFPVSGKADEKVTS
jgi:hypothetical protein